MISGGWPVPGVGVGEHVMAKGPQGLLYVGALSRGLLAVSGVTTAAGVGGSLTRCCTWLPAVALALAGLGRQAGAGLWALPPPLWLPFSRLAFGGLKTRSASPQMDSTSTN